MNCLFPKSTRAHFLYHLTQGESYSHDMEACASSHNENTEAYDMTNYQYSYASGPSLGTSNDDSIRPPLYYSPWSGPESVNMDANIVGLARGMDLPLSDPTTFPEPVAYSSLAPVNLVDYSILGDVFSRDNEEPILCRMTFEPPGNLWRAENSMPAVRIHHCASKRNVLIQSVCWI
jgi:hypothetical protein